MSKKNGKSRNEYVKKRLINRERLGAKERK
jgi:hypothetical protein